MLLRLAYLALTNTFTLMRLLPMTDQEKDIEILTLRHQLIVLQRQLGKPAFTQTDRMVLAGSSITSRRTSCASSCCWYARTRCCAGTAT